MIRTFLTFFIGFSFLFTSTGQTELVKTSLAPDGGSASSGNLEVVYTTGEVFIAEAGAGNLHLSEGFVGPDLAQLLHTEGFAPVEGVDIFPNPVKDFLTIKIRDEGTYEIHMFDLTGKLILHQTLEGDSIEIDMRKLRPAFYLISITDRKNKKFSSFKIKKI